MLKKILALPVKIAGLVAAKIMGRNTAPAAEPPPPPPPRKKAPAPPKPAARPAAEPAHDHGHGHDHGHDHGRDEAPPAPKAEPKAEAHKAEKAEPKAEKAEAHKAEKAEAHKAEKAPARKKPTVTAEDTPNPNARKFACSVKVVEKGSLSFNSAEEAEKHPLGKAVWAVEGVKSVFAVNDFVTVTKTDDADWAKLSPKLVKAIQSAL